MAIFHGKMRPRASFDDYGLRPISAAGKAYPHHSQPFMVFVA